MPETVPIYRGRDFYVPAFDIKIEGKSLPKETHGDVIEVRYMDNIDEFDTFEITFNNWDARTRDFKYTGSKSGAHEGTLSSLFDPGQKIELWMGYFKPTAAAAERSNEAEPLRLMLVGTLTSLAPSFPPAGQPTIKVRGQNVLRNLSTTQETHVYENKKDSQIAEAIGRRGHLMFDNLRIEVKTDEGGKSKEETNEHVLQENQLDIVFLLQRAHRNGYDLVIKDESRRGRPRPILYFGPPEEPRVTYLLEWGKSLTQFQPNLSTTRQVNEVVIRCNDALRSDDRRSFEVRVSRDQIKTRCLRDPDKMKKLEKGFQDRREVIVDRPFRNEREARRFATDRMERIVREMVTARGTTVGSPDLRAGRIIEVRDVGSMF
ncbi:MAG: phage late control D family protein [bacterium]